LTSTIVTKRTTEARPSPSTVCEEIVDLTEFGATLFDTVTIDDLKFGTDSLAKPVSLSKLPTTVSIVFKKEVIIQNVSVVNPDESKIISINALTEYDLEPIENTNPTNPAVVYNPYLENVAQLEITLLKTKDNSMSSNVKLGIFGCSVPVKMSAKPPLEPSTTHSSGTISPSILTEITASATNVPDKNGTIATTPQQIISTTPPRNEYITTLTVATSSGTTTKICEETQ
ncbi:unnamed protein product, partial [Rotaria sp. Silwood1]